MHLDSAISNLKGLKMIRLSPPVDTSQLASELQNLLTKLAPGTTIQITKLPTGEVEIVEGTQTNGALVAEAPASEAGAAKSKKTKEQIIREKYPALIGRPITVSEAAEKYDVPDRTVLNWEKKGYLTVIKPGYGMELDEADVAYCAGIYHKKKAAGVGYRGSPLLDEEGLEYQVKHESLSRYRRRKKNFSPF